MIDTQSIRAFLAVSDSASFSRAAEALHLTQPAVSKRIQALENALGTPLFDRIGKSVRLTEAGHALIPSYRRVLAEIAESERIVSNLRSRTTGILSVATSHHIGLHRLPAVLRDYSQQYPDVELKIGFMDSEEACHQVINGDQEIAIITLPDEPDDRLELSPVWHDPLTVAVARKHPLAGAHGLTVERLREYAAILPSTGTYTRKLIDKALGLDPRVNTLLETHYLETIKAMVGAGLGWSMLPTSMLDSTLVSLDIRHARPTRQLGVVVHRLRTNSSAANAMVNLLVEYADQTKNA